MNARFALFAAGTMLMTSGEAFAAPRRCLPDGTQVTVNGVIRVHNNHDRATGKPYTFTVIEADRAYCVSDEDADDRSRTPARTIGIAKPSDPNATLARRYANRAVIAKGKLVGTNGGGPYIWYDSIQPKP